MSTSSTSQAIVDFGSNIGNNAQALWKRYDGSKGDSFVQQRQSMHVSILSFCSFLGRLFSGVGSDVLVSKMNRSRFWCLFMSAILFCVAQICALSIQNPHLLGFISGITGLAYGVLFGVYPALVAHMFGIQSLSQNWGTMTLAPVVSGNIFNLIYGKIYDSHSIVDEEGHRQCLEGLSCYSAAYRVTFSAALASVAVCLWSIWHENEVHKMDRNSKARPEHERDA